MSKERTLRLGIAGYGIVGARRHQFIRQYSKLNVIALCDLRFQDQSKVVPNIPCYTNYKEMLENENLDALFVCLPVDLASEVTIAGLQKGFHVFCEKPPARNLKEMNKVLECEKENPKLKLKYGFNHRYHGSVKDALKMIRSRQYGKIINMRGVYGKSAIIPWPRPSIPELRDKPGQYWRTSRAIAGGGILLDQGIHMVDLMGLFAGNFSNVKSFVKNSFWKHDVEDNAYALMSTESGIVAMLHSTATEWRHRFNLEINLDQASLILSGILSGTRSYGDEQLTIVHRDETKDGNPSETTHRYLKDESWNEEIIEFIDAVSNNKTIETGTSQDAFRTLELVYKIYCADEKWRDKYELSDH